MARKVKNTVDYFPHVVTHGKTLTIIEARYSHLGYSFFFKLLEHLGKSDNHYLDFRDETEMQYIFADIKVDEDKGIDILNLMAKLGAIDNEMWKEKVVFSQNFIDGVEDAYKRRNNKCMQLVDLCKHLKLNAHIKAKSVDINTQTILYDIKPYKTKTIEERIKEFEIQILTINNTNNILSDIEIQKFISYWTEYGERSKKFRQEKETTWDSKKRLERWKLNISSYGQDKRNNEPAQTEIQRRADTRTPEEIIEAQKKRIRETGRV